MNCNTTNEVGASVGTRRSFLKHVSLSTVSVVAGGESVALSGEAGESMPPYIRLRDQVEGHGWKYHKIATLSRDFPEAGSKANASVGKFGGDSSVKWQATGTFRLERGAHRWWLVDPEGHPFISCGVNTINSRWNKLTIDGVLKKGTERDWLETSLAQLKSAGFNSAGYWSMVGRDSVAYTYYDFSEPDDLVTGTEKQYGLMACFMSRLAGKGGRRFFPAFHAAFRGFCDERAKRIGGLKGDPWLIGYFTDNELAIPTLASCLKLDHNDSEYHECGREARKMWEARKTPQQQFPSAEDEECWAAHVYEWYLEVATSSIRRHDDSHLILGSRLYARERAYRKVFEAVARYVDVVSVNPYGIATVTPGRVEQWSEWATGKPVLIGEFYVKSLDAIVKNNMGAGLVVPTQNDRAGYYQNFVLNLLQSTACVGWFWHQFTDGVRVNTGLVDSNFQPYRELYRAAKEINVRAHEIAKLASDKRSRV